MYILNKVNKINYISIQVGRSTGWQIDSLMIDRSTCLLVDMLNRRSVNLSTVGLSTCRLVYPSTCQPVIISTRWPVNPLTCHSSTCLPIDLSTHRLVNLRPVNLSTSQPVNPSTRQPVYHRPVNPSTHRHVNLSTHQPVYLSTC